MEEGAAPAGAGLTWPCALGRLRGTARRALGPGREELADARGNSPPRSAAWSRIDAAVERREASALEIERAARRRLICAPADRSRREHKAGAPLGAPRHDTESATFFRLYHGQPPA